MTRPRFVMKADDERWFLNAGLTHSEINSLRLAMIRVFESATVAGGAMTICTYSLHIGDAFAHLLPDATRATRAIITANLLLRGFDTFFEAVSGTATPDYFAQFTHDPLVPLGVVWS